MRRILLLVLAVTFALSGDVSLGSTPLRQVQLSSGISVRLPGGWRILRPLTSCSDPKERLAVATFPASRLGPENAVPKGGALILVLEDQVNPASAFSARPTRFRLRGQPTPFEGCCDLPTSPGYEFRFRDHGRDFEALAFVGGSRAASKLRGEASGILTSLLIAHRR
jgi:hypothetical protein